ncbi:hypothetical protein BGZ98_006982 [Dissophora globulifera]|nr:hypothetical protein BGZ98_006982 [Dissophora globulifera]
MESQQPTEPKKKFERKSYPSKAPRRLLKKKLRDLERLIKNKNTLKDMPEEILQETEKKIAEVKKQMDALGPESAPENATANVSDKKQNQKKEKAENSNTMRFTEMRRAGRKITSFKKQNPGYAASEEQMAVVSSLELDLLYTKHFPKNEEYILIYSDPPLADEEKIRKQAEIRENIAKAHANGELKKTGRVNAEENRADEASAPATGKHPVSNWSDDESEDSDEEESKEPKAKKQKQKTT